MSFELDEEPDLAEWDLNTEEIASVASDELAANRPNRWAGGSSTWRHLTEEERVLWYSMNQLRNQDISVHLYNAFALKRQGQGSEMARDLTIRMEDGKETVWTPPKAWTAWPLKERQLPREGLFKQRESDESNEQVFTFCKQEKKMASSELHEELIATMLRLARQRFLKRKEAYEKLQPSTEKEPSPTAAAGAESDLESEAIATSTNDSSGDSESESMQVDSEIDFDGDSTAESVGVRKRQRRDPKTYYPIVSTNDDFSFELLRPFSRHIISQLEDTLRTLHNSRVSNLCYLSDSSTEDESDSQTSTSPVRRSTRNRRRSRTPRSTSRSNRHNDVQQRQIASPSPGPRRNHSASRGRGRPRRPVTTAAEVNTAAPQASRRGRPPKVHIPQDGETHDAMLQRVARESHRRIPTTTDERDVMFEEWLRKGEENSHSRSIEGTEQQQDKQIERSPPPGSEPHEPPTSTSNNKPQALSREERLRRWALRDWRDIVGAAALAGFPHTVLTRTAQRCADLFGQEMTLTRLEEVPLSRAAGAEQTTRYRPEHFRASYSASPGSADGFGSPTLFDEEHKQALLAQRRIWSRQASVAQSSQGGDPELEQPSLRGRSSTPASQSQLSSRARAFCPVPSCERAVSGFTRSANLRRHMQTIHPGHDAAADDDDENDPEPDQRSRRAGSSAPGSQSRSRSQSIAGTAFCPVPSCERAASGFARRTNLVRHMHTMHPGYDPASVAATADDEDSEDEVFGAVHIDGYLRPIQLSRGWRGEDARWRKRKRIVSRGDAEATSESQSRPASPQGSMSS